MQFIYRAINARGDTVTGTVAAASVREAARKIERQGLVAVDFQDARKRVRIDAGKRKPSSRDILLVLQELATLVESGIPVADAVRSLADSAHAPFVAEAFGAMAARIRRGASFSDALKASSFNLPPYLYQLAETGEMTGKLAAALRDGVDQFDYELRVASEARSALIYPMILMGSGVAAVLLIFTIVVPRFASMIARQSSEDVPWLARAVMSTGMFFHEHFAWLLGGGIGLGLLAAYAAKRSDLRERARDYLSAVPALGTWLVEAETGKWAATLGTLLENRVPLMYALELAQQGIRLGSLRARLEHVTKSVRSGEGLSEALESTEALTPTGWNLIRVGEQAGELPRMLKSLAKVYEQAGRERMKRALLLIEPIAILGIGSVIGVVITGIILAITSVNQIAL